jgi:hypothetical protein
LSDEPQPRKCEITVPRPHHHRLADVRLGVCDPREQIGSMNPIREMEFPVPSRKFPVPSEKFPVPLKKFPVPQRTGNSPATR